jgi:hypothetical protein
MAPMITNAIGNFAQIAVGFQTRRVIGLFRLSLISGLGRLVGRLGHRKAPVRDYR